VCRIDGSLVVLGRPAPYQFWEMLSGNIFGKCLDSVWDGETFTSLRNGVQKPLFTGWFPGTLSSPRKGFREPLGQYTVWESHYLTETLYLVDIGLP